MTQDEDRVDISQTSSTKKHVLFFDIILIEPLKY